jgi:hypothetical protein
MRRLVPAVLLVLAVTAPALAAPVDDVKSALLKLSHARAYHVSVSGARAVDVDVVKPDSVHVMAGAMEMISIGSGTWIKTNGSWMKLPTSGAGPMRGGGGFTAPVARAQSMAEHPDTMATVTDRGVATVDGETLHLYQVQANGDTKPMTLGVSSDGFPRSMETVDASGKTSRLKFTRYDDPTIVISAPT